MVAPQFADTDPALLESAVQSYKDIGAYCTAPAMSEESFSRLQEVMTQAGELEQTAPFADVVDNTFAENAQNGG